MLRFGRRALPDAVAAVALDPGERRQAWAQTSDGGAVIATDLGLRLPTGERWDWSDVERVSWKRPVLVVLGISELSGRGESRRLELIDGGDLPETVRSAVTASIGWSAHYRLRSTGGGPAGGVRIVGRRRPGRELLDWQLVYDAGTDLDDPAIRLQAEQLRDDARRAIG